MSNRVVVGAQWGDEGKAKIVDYLTDQADVVVRFQGGANAGHTVEVGDTKFIFHLIPDGIMHADKVCVIGNGVVLDPEALIKELHDLKSKGIDTDGRLFISSRAALVMPYHKIIDQANENSLGRNKIGTTGRGIGPAYVDKVARVGVRVGDLLNPEFFRDKVRTILREKNKILPVLYGLKPFKFGDIIRPCLDLIDVLRPMIMDTSAYLNQAMGQGKRILFEGAQGAILDIDHGTYPFVTSSNTVAGAACVGSGVGPTCITEVIGISKAYTTRVGMGPFPTELGKREADKLRRAGNEFGATTGRPRRCGWFDAIVIKKAADINGLTSLAITKLDVLSIMKRIKICTAYKVRNQTLNYFPDELEVLEKVKPVYEEMPGWETDIGHIRHFENLPENAKKYIQRLHELSGVPVKIISVGTKREQTIKID